MKEGVIAKNSRIWPKKMSWNLLLGGLCPLYNSPPVNRWVLLCDYFVFGDRPRFKQRMFKDQYIQKSHLFQGRPVWIWFLNSAGFRGSSGTGVPHQGDGDSQVWAASSLACCCVSSWPQVCTFKLRPSKGIFFPSLGWTPSHQVLDLVVTWEPVISIPWKYPWLKIWLYVF